MILSENIFIQHMLDINKGLGTRQRREKKYTDKYSSVSKRPLALSQDQK